MTAVHGRTNLLLMLAVRAICSTAQGQHRWGKICAGPRWCCQPLGLEPNSCSCTSASSTPSKLTTTNEAAAGSVCCRPAVGIAPGALGFKRLRQLLLVILTVTNSIYSGLVFCCKGAAHNHFADLIPNSLHTTTDPPPWSGLYCGTFHINTTAAMCQVGCR